MKYENVPSTIKQLINLKYAIRILMLKKNINNIENAGLVNYQELLNASAKYHITEDKPKISEFNDLLYNVLGVHILKSIKNKIKLTMGPSDAEYKDLYSNVEYKITELLYTEFRKQKKNETHKEYTRKLFNYIDITMHIK